MSDKQTPPAVRPTPITDANEYDAGLLGDYGGGDVGWWQDYLRSEIGRANDHWRLQYDDLERQLAEARELIDEIETRHAATMLHTQAIVDDANSLRDQRDRLADTLKDIKDRAQDTTIMLHPDADAKGCVDDVLEWSEQALAAVKGGPQ